MSTVFLNYRLLAGEVEKLKNPAEWPHRPIPEWDEIEFCYNVFRAVQVFLIGDVDLGLNRARLVDFTVGATKAVLSLSRGAEESCFRDSESGYRLEFKRSGNNVVVRGQAIYMVSWTGGTDIEKARAWIEARCNISELSTAFLSYSERVYNDLCEQLPELKTNEWFESEFGAVMRGV